MIGMNLRNTNFLLCISELVDFKTRKKELKCIDDVPDFLFQLLRIVAENNKELICWIDASLIGKGRGNYKSFPVYSLISGSYPVTKVAKRSENQVSPYVFIDKHVESSRPLMFFYGSEYHRSHKLDLPFVMVVLSRNGTRRNKIKRFSNSISNSRFVRKDVGVEEDCRKLYQYLEPICNEEYYQGFKQILYLPVRATDSTFSFTLIIGLTLDLNQDANLVLSNLIAFVNKVFQTATARLCEINAVRSAIGSIMSRNGSHNIGSHVLAALSHNVGTMPDDRVLYQYIQHRMDYTATATTEFPAWRQPTMFLGSIMKTFLSQRHLLDNIAASEGLRAWKFQVHGQPANRKDNVATIKIRILKIEGTAKKELLDYDTDAGRMCLDEDVSLAITGGTVGQHAFFTILENVIRNAAKHDWSSPPRKTRKNKFKRGKISGNLEILIAFEDLPDEGNVEFTISSNMSDADDKEGGKTTLFSRLTQAIDRPFIENDGKLRSENWGIAEMKISAGYLQGRELGVIGGLEETSSKALDDERKYGGKIIEPVIVPEVRVNHLGYKFKIPKARTLLIVVDDKTRFITLGDKEKELARCGIYLKDNKEVGKNKADNSFEFVLMDCFPESCLDWQLPFRIVCMNECNNCEWARNHVAIWTEEDKTNNSTAVSDIVLNLLNSDSIEIEAGKLLERIAALWVVYLAKTRGITTPISLQISTELTSRKRSGQSLVNAASVVQFVFEEGMEKAIESFKKLYRHKSKGLVPKGKRRLSQKYWKETERVLSILERASKEGLDASLCKSDADIKVLLNNQFYTWLDFVKNRFQNVWSYLSKYKENQFVADKAFSEHPFKAFVDYLTEVCKQAKGYLGQYAEEISTLPTGFNASSNQTGQTTCYKENSEKWDDAKLNVYLGVGDGIIPSGNSIKYFRHYTPTTPSIDNLKSKNQPPSFVANPFQSKDDLYIEPLSGTQSYLSQLRSLSDFDSNPRNLVNRRLLQAKLVECGLLRILIVDERVSRFINTHSNFTLATFALMNISVVDDKVVTDALEEAKTKMKGDKTIISHSCFTENISYTPRGLLELNPTGIEMLRKALLSGDEKMMEDLRMAYNALKEKFDILIVHQGILDKWFNGVSNDKNKMTALYNSLKHIFQYVIITTGRGTPANIPDRAKVLPFSTIETTLFRKYPEKLVLVDAIMNILPIIRP